MRWLLITLACSTASATQTPAEDYNLDNAGGNASRGNGSVKGGYFIDAVEYYAECYNTIEPFILQNPALESEIVRGTNPPVTAKALLDYCGKQYEQFKPLASDSVRELQGEIKSIYSRLRGSFDKPTDDSVEAYSNCISKIEKALKTYPALSGVILRPDDASDSTTIQTLGQKCQVSLVEAEKVRLQKFAGLNAKVLVIIQQFDKQQALFLTIRGKPENTASTVLSKYSDLQKVDEQFRNFLNGLRILVDDGLRDSKIGNTTILAFFTQLDASKKQSAAALITLKPKADRAYEQQYEQIKSTMPKITSGDRLAIFKRYGVPYNWAGGQQFSKNGLESGDGVAVAKDLMSASKWFYNQDSSGCYHYFTFSKNTLIKTEKPYGCD